MINDNRLLFSKTISNLMKQFVYLLFPSICRDRERKRERERQRERETETQREGENLFIKGMC
jgi:hypothetical protein